MPRPILCPLRLPSILLQKKRSFESCGVVAHNVAIRKPPSPEQPFGP